MDERKKEFIKIYCGIAGWLVFFIPICKITPNGAVIRAAFPDKYVPLSEFIKYKSNNLHIDWSLLALELLLLTFIFICIYLSNENESKSDTKDKKKE